MSLAVPCAAVTLVSVSLSPAMPGIISPLTRFVRLTVWLCPTVIAPVAAVGPGSIVMPTVPESLSPY